MGWVLAGGCALFGLVLGIDGALHQTLDRYRYVAYGLGTILTLPLAIRWMFRRRGGRFLKLSCFAAVPSLCLVLVADLTLQIGGFTGTRMVLRQDRQLGHRLEPGVGEADAWGFRNLSVPERVDAVFLGDSQVFGYGVDRDSSIPAQFTRASGLSAQNLGLIGYGPVQYRELTPQALELHPKALVIGFYLGNDVIDAYSYAHLEAAADLRLAGHIYPDHQIIELAGKESPNLAMGLVDFLRDSSRVVDLAMTGIKNSMLYTRTLAGIYQDEPGAPAHEGGRISTLFTPKYRFATLDLDNEGVREGMRISELCLEQIATRAAAAKVPVMLLLIHTKEFYYQRYYEQSSKPLAALARLDAAEQAAAKRLVALAARDRMIIVDPSDEIVAALSEDHALWKSSSDGHPNAAGYGVFAHAVLLAWRQLKPGKGR